MNHPVCYVSTMLLRHCHLLMLLFLAASSATAGTIPVPAVSESPFADTESVTNAVVRPSLIQRARTFSGDIALHATPSNALEVAFGTSRDSDGILLPGDETFSIGWADGAWFIASPTNRIATAALVGAMRRSLSFSVRVSEEGIPTKFTVSGGRPGRCLCIAHERAAIVALLTQLECRSRHREWRRRHGGIRVHPSRQRSLALHREVTE